MARVVGVTDRRQRSVVGNRSGTSLRLLMLCRVAAGRTAGPARCGGFCRFLPGAPTSCQQVVVASGGRMEGLICFTNNT